MKKGKIRRLLSITLLGAMLASNIICIHEWSGNNCCQVNHCYKCGKVDPNGKIDPDAHSWNSATCTEPKTCVNCRKTVGEKNPDNHCFEDRSDGSKVCTRCGKIIPAPNSTDEAGQNSHDFVFGWALFGRSCDFAFAVIRIAAFAPLYGEGVDFISVLREGDRFSGFAQSNRQDTCR